VSRITECTDTDTHRWTAAETYPTVITHYNTAHKILSNIINTI